MSHHHEPGRIAEVIARQILDSRGNPTVEVDVVLDHARVEGLGGRVHAHDRGAGHVDDVRHGLADALPEIARLQAKHWTMHDLKTRDGYAAALVVEGNEHSVCHRQWKDSHIYEPEPHP